MLRRLIAAAMTLALVCAPAGAVVVPTQQTFQPTPAYQAINIVNSTAVRAPLPVGQTMQVYNLGAVDMTVLLGDQTATAIAGSFSANVGDVIHAGCWMSFTVGPNLYASFVTAGGATSALLSGGSGAGSSGCAPGNVTATVAGLPGLNGDGGALNHVVNWPSVFPLAGFAPTGNYAAITNFSSGASTSTALPAGSGSPQTIVVYNTGSNPVSVKQGTSSVTNSFANGDVIQPGSWMAFVVTGSYLSAIAQTGQGSVVISGGSGWPSGAGGGGGGGSLGGTVGISGNLPSFATTQTFNLGTLNGAALASLQPALNGDGGALSHITNFPSAFGISGSLPGFASTPTVNVGTLPSVAIGSMPAVTVSGFAPTPAYSQLAVGASSTRVSLPTGSVIVVYNTGANDAYVALGNSSVTASAANDVVKAGGWMAFTVGANTFLAGIETAGTTALNISGGSGLPSGTGSGGGGSVGGSVSLSGTLPAFASTPTFNLGALNGAALASLQPAINGDGGSLAHVTNFPSTFGLTGTLPAFASTPTFNLGTLNGAATAANQTNVQSAPGSSAAVAVTVQGSASGVPVPAIVTPKTGTFAFAGASVGVSSAQALASGSYNHVQIQNASASATIACAWGSAAVINGSGSVQLAAGQSALWGPTTSGVPSGALNCIASAASTPLYVESN